MTYQYEYPRASVTVDAAVLRTPELHFPEVLLIKRKNSPFKDCWALPGGFLEMDEKPLTGAARELEEETGLKEVPLKPLFACGELNRDPRGRTITMVFACLIRDSETTPIAADDASEVRWFPLRSLPEMAFDHDRVLEQIAFHLLWQASNLIVGRDVFHSVASAKEVLRLHQNLTGKSDPDFLANAQSKKLISCKEGLCEYHYPPPAGPDWQPMVW